MQAIPYVVHLVVSLDRGGLERMVVDLTKARNRMCPGSTAICCLDAPGDMAAEVESGKLLCLNACRDKFPVDVSAIRRLRKALLPHVSRRPSPPVIVHSHNLAAQQYAALATIGMSTKHVHTEHGTNVHTRGLKNVVRNRMLGRLTDRIVAVSQDVADTIRAQCGVPADKLRVIFNGVSPHPVYGDDARSAIRREFNISNGAFVIGSVGRLARVKGYDRLLGSFAGLLAGSGKLEGGSGFPNSPIPKFSNPPILLLVGDGPERAALETQARDLDMEKSVVFAGYQRAPRKFLEAMDLFVLPSRSEGVSVALLEAMAAGCPVAAGNVGANREIIENGKAGLLLSDDVGQWADQIRACLADAGQQELKRKAERGRIRALEQYSLERTLGAYEEVYRDIAACT